MQNHYEGIGEKCSEACTEKLELNEINWSPHWFNIVMDYLEWIPDCWGDDSHPRYVLLINLYVTGISSPIRQHFV